MRATAQLEDKNMINRMVSRAVRGPAATGRAFAGAVAALALVLAVAFPAAAQDAVRMWAAQTSPTQVSLAWDEVPGAIEYRIHLGDPNSPGTFLRQPWTELSGSGRSAILTGVQKAAAGIAVAAGAGAGSCTSAVQPITLPRPSAGHPPDGVTAQATSATEITVADLVPVRPHLSDARSSAPPEHACPAPD
jgi:hypothetical protein